MAVIGIIADTHGRLSAAAYAALADCDRIVHAGDIGSPAILRELETLALVVAVLGNNDFPEYGDAVGRHARFELDGVRFLVAHYPNAVKVSGVGSSALAPGDPVPDVCIHGHTHLPRLDTGQAARPASLVLCPGSASLPRGGYPCSVAKLQVEKGRLLSARVESLSGDPILEWTR